MTKGGALSGVGRRIALRVMSIAFGIAAGLSLVEAAARMIGVRSVVMDANMYVTHPDPLLPYMLRPGFHGYFAGGEVSVDNEGRRRIVTVDVPGGPTAVRPGGPKNIVLLGDSMAFGLGLDDSQTIASRLKTLLVKNDLPISVDAIAVPGYTSWNEYAALRDYGHLDRTQTVVLIYYKNDITYDNDTLKIKDGEMAIVSNSPIHQFLRWMYSHIYVSHLVVDGAKKAISSLSGTPSSDFIPADEGALQYSLEALQKAMELCRRHNIDFVIGLYRDVEIFTEPNAEESYERRMADAFRQANIPFFVLREHTDKLSPARARVAWNDTHPSAEAADLLAQQIFRELKARGWLGRDRFLGNGGFSAPMMSRDLYVEAFK